MNYYDVTYRDEGSNIYQSIIVQASRSELAEQYVKDKDVIITGVVEKANIDEDIRKGKPVIAIKADRLLTKTYIETLLKEERLWKEGEADNFQYKNWILTLSKENKEYFPFKYIIEGKKIGTNETWCRRYMSMYRALLHIVNDFNENINIKDNYGNLSEYIYPVGTRIELVHMNNPQAVPSGTRGTVEHIDDAGQIHMKWDNGRSLAVMLEVDDFRLLTKEEIIEEKVEYWHTHDTGNSLKEFLEMTDAEMIKEFLPESNKEPDQDKEDDYDY